jgi:AcrR family transcriptional regulator
VPPSATTVKAIAQAAGVSAATIYKTYGGKAGLVRALCQHALEREGPIPAEERSNALRELEDGR